VGRKLRILGLLLSITSILFGVLGYLETNYHADGFIHGQNFTISITCNYGQLANKEIQVGETEWNFRFANNQYLQTAITQIRGGNSSIWLIHGGDTEPIYELHNLPVNQTFTWSGVTKPGQYLWEFKGNSSTIEVRATASFTDTSLWIGNCIGGPVPNFAD